MVIFVLLTGCEEALEKTVEGKKVMLLAPTNNLVSTDTKQTFYWEPLDGAIKYQLQVVSPRFDSIVKLIADTPVIKNNLLLQLTPGVYQWRVRASSVSTVSDYSEMRKITIQ